MNPYEILGLDKHCSKKDIDKALRKLSKIHHPDVGGNAEQFNLIMLAVQILRDPHRRKLFDEHGLFFDHSENLIQQDVMAKFKELIVSWIKLELGYGREFSLNQFLIEQVQEQFQIIEKKKKELNGHINTLNARKKSIKVSNEKQNIVHIVIDEQIQIIKNDIMNLERTRYVAGLIKDIANEYSSEEIQTNIMNSSTTSSFYFRSI